MCNYIPYVELGIACETKREFSGGGSSIVGRRILIYIEVAAGSEVPGSSVAQIITSANGN